ncbi:hypothetical protein D9613_004348 [Agrocybe pediades]|uniref:Uncharacterized protein n=1 Tax=Agrocybe pediades TaxID=84607 RepID=A0A8H4QIR6_9AGAR|nr:hypothetical protein D9613_004348 [Agrocybe pediades]
MLNPPLSILPYDVLVYIVDHVAALCFHEDLRALCLTDRVFTYACQKWIFKTLRLFNSEFEKATMDEQLQTKGRILAKAPELSRWIRNISLSDINDQLTWLLLEPRFISIMQMFALSPAPPNELVLEYFLYHPVVFRDVRFFIRRLSQSFLPRTLTTLRLRQCRDVPLTIITMLPRLKSLYLDDSEAREKDYPAYGSELLESKHIPAIEVLQSRRSHTMLALMTVPFNDLGEYVVKWDKLRILHLSPQERESMQHLPRILSLSRGSLEELYLDAVDYRNCINLPLAELVDLSILPELRIFTMCFDLRTYDDVTEVNTILQTIPGGNKLTNIRIEFPVKNSSTLGFDYYWSQLCAEVKRVSAQRRLEFELEFYPYMRSIFDKEENINEQVKKLQENLSSLMTSESTVCLHVWFPFCWSLGIAPMNCGTYREQCK